MQVTWKDLYDNSHDLDFVIERDGDDQTLGRPVAFIEVAWRRYTKHSRNKAQVGFQVLYFPYSTLISAFGRESIEIQFDEATPDEVFRQCTETIERAPIETMELIKGHLITANQQQIDLFFAALHKRLARIATRVLVIPLYGKLNEFTTIEDAVRFLDQHRIYEGSGEFRKYEVDVEFSNGDKVDASLDSKQRVKEFLEFVSRQ